MKKLSLFLLFILCIQPFAKAQYASPEEEILDLVKLQEPLSRSIFLDSVSLPGMKVYSGNTRQGWVSEKPDAQKIMQLYDIRLKFTTHDSARAFHKRFMDINSEFGKEIAQHTVDASGAVDFKLFGASDESIKILEPQGLQMICFTMVVDRYFAKLFILCKKNEKAETFQYLVTDLIGKIKRFG